MSSSTNLRLQVSPRRKSSCAFNKDNITFKYTQYDTYIKLLRWISRLGTQIAAPKPTVTTPTRAIVSAKHQLLGSHAHGSSDKTSLLCTCKISYSNVFVAFKTSLLPIAGLPIISISSCGAQMAAQRPSR